MSIRTRLFLPLIIVLCPLFAGAAGLTVTVLSSRPDMVSGGSALIEIKTAQPIKSAHVKLNGKDVSRDFHRDTGF